MKPAPIRIATAALSRRIFAGRLNKAGDALLCRVDVTIDVLKAIIDKIGEGNTEVITENGVPVWEIEVRRCPLSTKESK